MPALSRYAVSVPFVAGDELRKTAAKAMAWTSSMPKSQESKARNLEIQQP